MIPILLLLEVYDGRGLVKVYRNVQLPFLPHQGESFTVGPGLICSVEQVTGDIGGGAEVRLRLKGFNVPDTSHLIARLVEQGWQPAS